MTAPEFDLAQARDWYQWDHDYLRPLPMLRIDRTGRSPGILEFLGGAFLELPPPERADDDMPVTRGLATAPGIAHLALERLVPRLSARPKDPADYLSLLHGLATPATQVGATSYASMWDTDFAFAWQRLAGPNPMTIERPDVARWKEVDGRLGLTDAHVRQALSTDDSVAGLLASGRLFVTDYRLLADPTPIPCGVTDNEQKFLGAPIGAFAWDAARAELAPIAIRLGQGVEHPLVVRDGSEAWRVARGWLSAADFNLHEMAVHLSDVHFLQEGMIVATRRTLPSSHPIAQLLAPHHKYVLLNNFAGRELLVEPGGFVEQILAGQLAAGSLEIVRRAYDKFHFDDLDVPNALRRRGVFETEGLPVFPYRDDALLIWAALEPWVSAYVDAFYPDDASVERDASLLAWSTEMTAPIGAHLRGFPERIVDRPTLVDVLTRMIFLAGPQHAAVNYPQYPSMMVIPNLPGAVWDPSPLTLGALLPPTKTALTQLEAIFLLTCYRYGTFGEYGGALNSAVAVPLAAFQAALVGAEATIQERDRTTRARTPYPYLRPSRIPNSSNI